MQCVCIRVETEAKGARCFQVGWVPSIGTTPGRMHHWLIEMHKATRHLVGRLILCGSGGPTERISSFNLSLFQTMDRKQEPVERPAIARGIGTLIYFKRFTGTIVLQSFVFGL